MLIDLNRGLRNKTSIRSNRKQSRFNQQKQGEMTYYTSKISFSTPIVERCKKIIKVRKFVPKVAQCT